MGIKKDLLKIIDDSYFLDWYWDGHDERPVRELDKEKCVKKIIKYFKEKNE